MIQTCSWNDETKWIIFNFETINFVFWGFAILQIIWILFPLFTIIIILLLFLFLHLIQLPQYNHDKLKKGSHIKPVGTNMAQHQRYIQVCSNIYYNSTRQNTQPEFFFLSHSFSCTRTSMVAEEEAAAKGDMQMMMMILEWTVLCYLAASVCYWLFSSTLLPTTIALLFFFMFVPF